MNSEIRPAFGIHKYIRSGDDKPWTHARTHGRKTDTQTDRQRDRQTDACTHFQIVSNPRHLVFYFGYYRNSSYNCAMQRHGGAMQRRGDTTGSRRYLSAPRVEWALGEVVN